MNLVQLKALSTKDLTALYNQYAEKQVKRMADRKTLQDRTAALLEAKGLLEKPKTAKEASNIRATAKAGANTGSTKALSKTEPDGRKSGRKSASKADPAPKTGKAPAKSPDKPAKGRGAPTKNPTYTAIEEGAKGYNPKKFRVNPSSSRFVVLDFLRTSKSGKTKDECVAKFKDVDINVTSSLYFLAKYGFATVAE